MDLHVLLLALPNILTSPQCSSLFIGSKLNSGFNIRSSPLHNLLHITEPKYLHMFINIKPPSRTRFLISSVSFPSNCFQQAQVCQSIIPQLLSPLMELSTNKSKILCSWHTSLHHSHQLYSFLPLQGTLSFFRALKPTSSLFPTFYNFSALPLLPRPFQTGQF